MLERRAQEPNLTRAFAVHARTLELLDGSASDAALRRALIRNGLRVPAVRRRIAERLSGLGIAYPRPPGSHRRTGQRMALRHWCGSP